MSKKSKYLYRLNKDMVKEKFDQEILIYDIKGFYLFTLNNTASFIFKKLQTGSTEEEIALALQNKYQVDYTIALTDIHHITEELLSQNILIKAVKRAGSY
jgi:hypothetical protein